MPPTQVVFYQDDDGSVPAIDWLLALPAKVQDKLFVRIERLQSMGYELRRPEADFLRDGIYELRVRHKRMNYRLLYFFHDDVARNPERHTHFR
ncbi:MAG: type II toxin-antitoxin system RelE/ParE family toxin [Planctomycetes bacterium]|nr:type II toxin-antitoxin system RelE/ParE family toxin [Planctomycetota bacterium]